MPKKKATPGKTLKTLLKTLRLVHCELECNPQVSAKKIEVIPGVLNAASRHHHARHCNVPHCKINETMDQELLCFEDWPANSQHKTPL